MQISRDRCGCIITAVRQEARFKYNMTFISYENLILCGSPNLDWTRCSANFPLGLKENK
jgi:hypothetical protein